MGETRVEFDEQISLAERGVVAELLAEWSALLAAGPVSVAPLHGGANNHIYTVRSGEAKLVLRVANDENERMSVNRKAALIAQEDASQAGLGPRMLGSKAPEGHSLSAFVEGRVLDPASLEEPDVVATIGRYFRRLHATDTRCPRVDPIADTFVSDDFARRDGTPMPDGHAELMARLADVREMLEGAALPEVFIHRDTVPQNFILGEDGLQMVDWDYAGRCWAMFEIGSFFTTGGVGEEMQAVLLDAYGLDVGEDDRALLQVMSFIAAMREGTWAVMAKPILAGKTSVERQWYDEFRDDNLGVAYEIAGSERFGELLESARRGCVRAGGGE